MCFGLRDSQREIIFVKTLLSALVVIIQVNQNYSLHKRLHQHRLIAGFIDNTVGFRSCRNNKRFGIIESFLITIGCFYDDAGPLHQAQDMTQTFCFDE